MTLLEEGYFNPGEPGIFDDVINAMKSPQDPWMTLADFRSYVDAQERATHTYQDQTQWVRKSIINSARSGIFSTDRTMKEYNDDIWHLTPIK
jgi:starch phosphorylase